MTSKPVLRRLVSADALGVFHGYSAVADVPELQQYNLVYGFNGSGKTTLSRLLSQLGSEGLHADLPRGATWSMELSDGRSLSRGQVDPALASRLLVFNVDFIEENLHWREGTANPVFYLGRQQAGARKELEKVRARLQVEREKHERLKPTRASKQRDIKTFNRNAARPIADELRTRRYNATNLKTDYESGHYGQEHRLSEEQREAERRVLYQEEPLPRLQPLDPQEISLADTLRSLKGLLSTTVGGIVEESFRRHASMLGWVAAGLRYHEEKGLTDCLFCGSSLPEGRLRDLRELVDDGFSEFQDQIAASTEGIDRLRGRIVDWKQRVPSTHEIGPRLRSRYESALRAFEDHVERVAEILDEMSRLAEAKKISPAEAVPGGTLPTEGTAARLEQQILMDLRNLDALIARHNEEHDDFKTAQEDAALKLKRHHLAQNEADFRRHQEEWKEILRQLREVRGRIKELEKQESDLQAKVREHGPAARIITRLIHSYLGHDELEIETSEDGYRLMRRGRPVTGFLSEGEKTAISLCYFLSMLDAEGRKKKDLIVVFDDPISSLDSNALHYAFCLIKNTCQSVGQLILLTHNVHFMNEAKRWLRRKNDRKSEETRAALLFLEVRGALNGKARRCQIVEMPKYIRDYESEYHHFFHLILRFRQTREDREAYFFLMPNVLRKVLEIFLSFLYPGSSGLGSKLQRLTSSDGGVDKNRLMALERLVQSESHADSIEDFVSYSPMSLEATEDAAAALMELIKTSQPDHYRQMVKICSA